MKKIKVALGLNLINIIFEITGFVIRFILYGTKDLFLYYTRDSSLFMLIASIIIFIQELLYVFKNKELSKWAYFIKYTAVGLTTLTFLTVLFALGPQMSTTMGFLGAYGFLLFYGDCLFQHFVCPVIGFVSFVFFENEFKYSIKDAFFALAPTFIYALIMFTLVALRVARPPYFFFDIYNQSVLASILWFSGMFGFIFMLYMLMKFINNRRMMK